MSSELYSKKRHGIVVKNNELIQRSCFDLSARQQKILLYLISQIQFFDEDFKLYEFNIREFCRVCGIDADNGNNYRDLKQLIKEIADKSVLVKTADGDEETLLRWIEKPYFNPKRGVVRIRFDSDMKPYLLGLQRNFTKYELIWTLHFKSKYAIRLYELLASIHYHDYDEITYEREFALDYFKWLMNCEKHKTFQAVKERVIMPAIEEINKWSNKTASYKAVKTGRSVTGIRFIISEKEPMERLRIARDIEKEIDPNATPLFDEMAALGNATEPETTPEQL